MQRKSRTWALWLFALLCVGSVGTLFVVQKTSAGEGTVSFDRSSGLVSLDRAKAGLEDSDKDGLRDWEESLWGTDPKNADSDGDGVLDGQESEILLQKTASLSGSSVLGDTTAVSDMSVDTLSLTDKLSYIAIQDYSEDGVLDTDTLSSIASEEMSNAFKFEKRYTANSLKITEDNSTGSLVLYANSLIDMVSEHATQVTFDELALIAEAIETQNASSLQKLDFTIALYISAINEGLSLTVPSSLVGHHLNLLNASWNAARYLSGAKNIFTDPAGGTIATQGYVFTLSKIHEEMALIDTYLHEKGAVVNTQTNHYDAP